MRQDRPNLRTPNLARQYYRMFDGYVRFGEDFWGRSWTIASGTLRRAVEQAERSFLGLRSSELLFRSLLDGYANYMSEMAMALPLAAETASMRMGRIPLMPREESTAGDGPVPRTSGVMLEVPGPGADGQSTPLALPVRIIDASQGWAVYVVPSRIVTEMLGESTDMVTPFDLGGGRALVAVMGIDYRVCDLGRYQEIALAVVVTVKGNRAGIPGAMFVGIGVNGMFSRDAGLRVWGLEKVFNEDLSVAYGADGVRFGLGSGHPAALSVSFPRFGSRRFDGVPILIHSHRNHGNGQGAPLQSMMSLSGHGGGVQIGGSVSISLGSSNRAACLCQGSIGHCLCDRLQQLDVTGRLPTANGWTEHLSGIFEAPQALRPVVE